MTKKLKSKVLSDVQAIPHPCALLRVAEMYAADRAAVNSGILSLDLMEVAGASVASFIQGR